MDHIVENEESGGFRDEHPAQFDQSSAEIADKIQKADGYIVFVYTKKGTDEEGNPVAEGHSVVGAVPGVNLSHFLYEGVNSLNNTIKNMVNQHNEAVRERGQTEG